MPFTDRQREWLPPLVITGLPWFRASSYVNSRLKQFREEHSDFNLYLTELERLIKGRIPNEDYKPIVHLLENNICFIDKDFINLFVKLYNLCLSPKQTLDYIDDCHDLYLFIKNNTYHLSDYFEVYIKKCSWDAKTRKFIEIVLLPEKQIDREANYYHFKLTIPSLLLSNSSGPYVDQYDAKIELINNAQNSFNDALMLFKNCDEKTLTRILFADCVKQLEERDIIKLICNKDMGEDISVSEYGVPFKMGIQRLEIKKSDGCCLPNEV